MKRPYHIIVVGAGLAGLGAAYELTKHPAYRVTVLEQRDRVGGRVYALPVENQLVDFGGFIIYPWYRQFHRILDELKINDQLKPIPPQQIYYQLGDQGEYYAQDEIPFLKKDTALLGLKMAMPVFQARDVAAPALDSFDYMTGVEFFRDALNQPDHAGLYETYTDTVNQGYCYPPAAQFKMAFMAPFIFKSRFYGDVSSASYLSGGNQLPLALAKAIQHGDHTIRLNTTVTGCSGSVVHTTDGDLNADAVIFAQNVDQTVYQSVLPDVEINCSYTQYYAVTIELSAAPVVNGDAKWGGVFYRPNHQPLQVVSSIHLPILYGQRLERYVTLNIVNRQPNAHILSADELLSTLQAELAELFPGVTVKRLFNVIYWPQTMPLADEGFVGTMRERQGKLGHYFAGDWLGAPSMEAALITGVRAAEQLMQDTLVQYDKEKGGRLSEAYQRLNNKITGMLPVRR